MYNFSPQRVEKHGLFCTMAFGKNDSGMIIMEDLKDPNRGNGAMHNWNKNEIVDVSVAKLVMKRLATFHGIWISWLHNQGLFMGPMLNLMHNIEH